MTKFGISLAAVTCVAFAFASSAQAGLQFATDFTEVSYTPVADAIANGSGSGRINDGFGAPNGTPSYARGVFSGGGFTAASLVLVVDASIAGTSTSDNAAASQEFWLYLNSVTGTPELTGLALYSSAGTAANNWSFTFGAPVVLGLGANNVVTTGFTVNGTGLDANGFYDRIRFTFAIDNSGNTADEAMQIDSVANPEPGTWALFGLGAMGLAGMIRRRRRAKVQSDAS